MAFRTYWCVIYQSGKTFWGNATFRPVAQFSCELDLDLSHTVRAALLHGVSQGRRRRGRRRRSSRARRGVSLGPRHHLAVGLPG